MRRKSNKESKVGEWEGCFANIRQAIYQFEDSQDFAWYPRPSKFEFHLV
jgi:hypothetical protein